MDGPSFLEPFVLPTPVVPRRREGSIDVYQPHDVSAPLSARWLARPPEWLRCIALTYPWLVTPPAWNLGPDLRPVEAVAGVGDLPILLTRVGRENPEMASAVTGFLEAAAGHGAAVEVLEVPDGQHGFDLYDHTEQSRDAVSRAIAWVTATLCR